MKIDRSFDIETETVHKFSTYLNMKRKEQKFELDSVRKSWPFLPMGNCWNKGKIFRRQLRRQSRNRKNIWEKKNKIHIIYSIIVDIKMGSRSSLTIDEYENIALNWTLLIIIQPHSRILFIIMSAVLCCVVRAIAADILMRIHEYLRIHIEMNINEPKTDETRQNILSNHLVFVSQRFRDIRIVRMYECEIQ